jgi:hypothetical protein
MAVRIKVSKDNAIVQEIALVPLKPFVVGEREKKPGGEQQLMQWSRCMHGLDTAKCTDVVHVRCDSFIYQSMCLFDQKFAGKKHTKMPCRHHTSLS